MPQRSSALRRKVLNARARRLRSRRYGKLMRGLRSVPRPNTYAFKRQIFYENLFIVNTGTPLGYAFQQKFDQLPGYTDFTNLYDQYCIKKIVVKIIPKVTQHNLATTTTGNSDLPQVHSVVDYDDATTPTSVSQLVEYQSHRMTRGNQIHTRVIVPKVELSTSGTGNAPKSYQWLDCDDSSVNHRGIKVWFNAPQSAGMSVYYDMLVKVYFSMRNVL